jgi:PAS domain S-box-containing protein
VHLAVTRDITDRKHTQLILEQQASLLDLAHDAILTRNLDGTIMYWNQGAERAYGWSKSEALGQKSHVLLGTVFADTREVINEALLARGQWEGELTQTRRDGVQIFVASRQVLQFDEYGQPTTILEINRDFTGRKLAEDALRLSESRLNIALQKSLTGAWELNLKDNTAYHTLIHDSIFGYQTLLPKWTYEIFLDHVLPEDRHMVDQKFHEATATQTDWSFECRIRRIDGEIRWIYGTGGHVLNTQGKPDLLSGIIQDITDRKRAELALNQLNETLEQRVQEETEKNRQKEHLLIQQSRLAAMGEMIGNIAHQWRQPLNALTLVLANIEDAANHQELTPEYLENQTRNGERLIQKMSSTIDDFRHFFRPQKQAEPFSAIAAIEEARSLASASFHNNNIELRLEMREDVQIVGFANEFSQVLLNLLSNAKDAILSRHIQNGMVTIRLSRDELSAIIEVIDNGGGIPASAMEHIFEPYFSTKEMGTGIGLYMSKMIIETSMHGSILVRNVDSGAEFRIICPHISATVLRK